MSLLNAEPAIDEYWQKICLLKTCVNSVKVKISPFIFFKFYAAQTAFQPSQTETREQLSSSLSMNPGGRHCKFADIWLWCISWVSVRYQRQNLGRIITKFESCLTEFEEYLSRKLNGISRWFCNYRKVTINNFPFVYFPIVLHYSARFFDLCKHFSLFWWMGNKCHWNSILLLSFRIFCLWCQRSRGAKHKWND